MPISRKPIEIPPAVARQFVAEMRAYHAEQNDVRRGEIAAGARHTLLQQMLKGAKLRLSDVKKPFELMR